MVSKYRQNVHHLGLLEKGKSHPVQKVIIKSMHNNNASEDVGVGEGILSYRGWNVNQDRCFANPHGGS